MARGCFLPGLEKIRPVATAKGFAVTLLAQLLLSRNAAKHHGLSGMWDNGELLGRVSIVEDDVHTVTVVAEDGVTEKWNRVEFQRKFKQV